MRYAIVSKGLPIEQLKAEAIKAGAKDVTEAKLLNQVFCELTESQAAELSKIPGLAVKPLKHVGPDVVVPVVEEQQEEVENELWNTFATVRSIFTPPLTGVGLTVAVVDSGIRKTHEALEGKVIHEENFSDSPTADDVFGHGTQVAFVAAGGTDFSEISGVAPGALLFNIKVIGDDGDATEEEVVLGINRVCELVMEAYTQGLLPTDPMWPNVLNLSLGSEDDGDPDSPLRVACRRAIREFGLDVVAAAGNYGPNMTTITCPGTDPDVITVGAIETLNEIKIWERSSRGPTREGLVKPDFVFWGVDVRSASHLRDDGYVVKSGTSFSAPMLSGLTGLLWETGRRVYGDAWYFRWIEARELAPYYCLKPEDAPAVKGNTYGYGLPAMATMAARLYRGAPSQTLENMMLPFMMLIMIMAMLRAV